MELGDVVFELLGKVKFGVAALDVGAVEVADVFAVEGGAHRADGLEQGLNLVEMALVEDAGLGGGFVGGVREDVPAAEDEVFEFFELDEVFDLGRAALGALAQANRAQLGERTDRLRQAFAD